RGAFKQIVDLLETEQARDGDRNSFDYQWLIAENARLIGDHRRELKALREHYQKPPANQAQLATSPDMLIDRYFDVLLASGEEGRNELLACVQNPSSHQLQLINFLLRRGEKELTHMAIMNAPLPAVWKSSRAAEASLQLEEYGAGNEDYFRAALQDQPIGSLI